MALPIQPAILDAPAAHARFLVFSLATGVDPRPALLRLRDAAAKVHAVIGLGQPLVDALAPAPFGLRPFPGVTGAAVAFPSTQGAAWIYLPGLDRGVILDHALALKTALGEGFTLDEEVESFKYRTGHDLTGFEDGTENPKGDAALEAAFVAGAGAGLDGSSFVAAQRYRHDLARFHALDAHAQGHVIGRDATTNEELEDAPRAAHVKRTAQESFDPPAFMLRRSMPWGGAGEHGLYFVAFGASLDRFERVLRRMAGQEDGVIDALLTYTRALSGGYYWCPPLHEGRLDLRHLGL